MDSLPLLEFLILSLNDKELLDSDFPNQTETF